MGCDGGGRDLGVVISDGFVVWGFVWLHGVCLGVGGWMRSTVRHQIYM